MTHRETIVVPAPEFAFNVPVEVMDAIHDVARQSQGGSVVIKRGKFRHKKASPHQERLYEASRSLIDQCMDFLGKKSLELAAYTALVEPGKSHKLADTWHTDGGFSRQRPKGMIVSNVLPTEFAQGEISLVITDEDSKRYAAGQNILYGARLSAALETGDLAVVASEPYTAYGFTEQHIHRGVVNRSDQVVDRLFIRV